MAVASVARDPIVRPRLVERIAAASSRRIVLIVAPAGYGKSTALAHYLATLEEPVVRYDVGPEHGDLLAFLRGFAERVAPVAPDARATLAGAFENNGHSSSAGRDLATWMHAHLSDFRGTIAIDGVHASDGDPQVADFCASLAALTCTSIRWILVSRTASDLPVGTWLAYGDADLPIDEEDLRFTADELRVAGEDAGLSMEEADVSAMMALTGGWPTALGFALRGSSRSTDLERIAAMTREMAYSYFTDQIYRTLEEEERALLESSALLSEIDADVLVASGFDRARPMLDDLRRRFAFAFEVRPGIYRCNDLFRTFALHRVDRSGSASTLALRARLADGLERCGRVAEAVKMNVAAGRSERALDLLERCGMDLLAKGHRDAVAQGLSALDEATRRERPVIVALRGLMAEGAGNYDEADRLLEAALGRGLPAALRSAIVLRLGRLRVNRGLDVGDRLRALADASDATVESCDALAMLAAAAARAGEGARSRRLLERCALQVAGIDNDDGRARILQRAGIAYLEIGDVAEAERALSSSEAIASGRGLWSIATRARLGLSHIALFAHGDTALALEHADKAAAAAARAGELRGIEDATAFVLSICVRRGDVERVLALEQTMGSTASASSSGRYATSSRAMRSAWQGRFADAHRMLGSIVGSQRALADRATAYAFYALFLALDGEVARSGDATARTLEISNNRPQGPIGGMFFVFAKLFAALAEAICGRHTSAQRLLKCVSGECDAATDDAYQAIGSMARSLRTNRQIATAFEGCVARLETDGFGGYANVLRAVCDHLSQPRSDALPVRLTDSERRVLSLLSAGLAPKEVAGELGRSVLTIQTHIQNAIAKFDCHGRAEAIALAQRQKLI